ncbi:MAG: alpha/beta fold hydrolase [Candidatus Binatia bacterium]
MTALLRALGLAFALLLAPSAGTAADVFDKVDHHYVDNDGVTIHYVTRGRGPLVVLIHGFPDFWYGWREQIPLLARRFRVAAVDLRGYNLSDQPRGVEAYNIGLLASDIAAVVRDQGYEKAHIVGHDWGGGVAWTFAALFPQMTDRLVVLQTPHPRGLLRELRNNPQQLINSQYARTFQQEGAHLGFTAAGLAGWVRDPTARAHYVEAFERSDFEAMLHYYKANYPRAPYDDVALPTIPAPLLIIHGTGDGFLLTDGHNGVWNWVTGPITVRTVPGVGHFIQQDAADLVTHTIYEWLRRKL